MSEFKESTLEDWAFENPQAFGVEEWVSRQLSLPSGRLDLLALTNRDQLQVFELKAREIKREDILQAMRYTSDIDSMKLAPTIPPAIVAAQGPNDHCPLGLSDVVQAEADACGVQVFTVRLGFSVMGPWGFTEEQRLERDRHREAAVSRVLFLRNLALCQFLETWPCEVAFGYDERLDRFLDVMGEMAAEYAGVDLMDCLRYRRESKA